MITAKQAQRITIELKSQDIHRQIIQRAEQGFTDLTVKGISLELRKILIDNGYLISVDETRISWDL